MFKHLTHRLAATLTALLPLALAGQAQATPGDIYVSNLTGTIQRFTPGGTASVFASGLNQPIGLAFDVSGNLYAATRDNTIERFTPSGAASVFASTGQNEPYALAFDAGGNLYAANYGSYTVKRFTPDGAALVLASTNGAAVGVAIEPGAATVAVSKPTSAALLLLGLGSLGALRRRRAA